MPLEVGPGYVSPSSGGYTAPGAAPAPPVAPAPAPSATPDSFTGGYGPIAAPAAPAGPAPSTGGTYQVKSFFSNLWDQFFGPMVKGVWSFISGLFGGHAASAPAALPTR